MLRNLKDCLLSSYPVAPCSVLLLPTSEDAPNQQLHSLSHPGSTPRFPVLMRNPTASIPIETVVGNGQRLVFHKYRFKAYCISQWNRETRGNVASGDMEWSPL